RLKQNGFAGLDQRRKQKFLCRLFSVRKEIIGAIALVLLLRVEKFLQRRVGHGSLIACRPVRLPTIKFRKNDWAGVGGEHARLTDLRFEQSKIEGANRFGEMFPHAKLLGLRRLCKGAQGLYLRV